MDGDGVYEGVTGENDGIGGVCIRLDRDNTLPGLKKETLEELGKKDKPILLKKSVIDKNAEHHSEVNKEDYGFILERALYIPELIVPGHKDKPYFNFVSRVGEKQNAVVLLELSEAKDNYEIVNMYFARNSSRRTLENKGKKIKKQNE